MSQTSNSFLDQLSDSAEEHGMPLENPCTIELTFNAAKNEFRTYNYLEEGDDAKQTLKDKSVTLLYLTSVNEVRGLKRVAEGQFESIRSTPFRSYDDDAITLFKDGKKVGGGGFYGDIREAVKAEGAGVAHVYYCVNIKTGELVQFVVKGAPKGKSRKAAMLKAKRAGFANMDQPKDHVKPSRGFIGNPLFSIHTTKIVEETPNGTKFHLMGVKLHSNDEITAEISEFGSHFLPIINEYLKSAIEEAPATDALPVTDPEAIKGKPDFYREISEDEDLPFNPDEGAPEV